MANGELKYWVFHQEALEKALEEHVRERLMAHVPEETARHEAAVVRRFLLDTVAARPLQGGRAG